MRSCPLSRSPTTSSSKYRANMMGRSRPTRASGSARPLARTSAREQRLAAHVFAATEQQCGPIGIGVALDVPDEYDVVAAVMAILIATLEMRGGTDQYWRAAFRDHVVDLGELVLVLTGEFIRQLDLVVSQHVDDEMRALLEGRQALRVERGAPQHQGRRQRHRGKGVGGHPVKTAVGPARRDDRHAGRKGAERIAKIARVEALTRGASNRCGMAAGKIVFHDRAL